MMFLGNAAPMTRRGMDTVCRELQVDEATVWAIIQVETSGCGFLPDKRPVILFERHVFSQWTNGKFNDMAPQISSAMPGYYGTPGPAQYDRLEQAIGFNERAALFSTSWGIGQIMGFNHQRAGYSSVSGMIQAFVEGEDAQLLGMAMFIVQRGLQDDLRHRDWLSFAFGYNGPGYRHNRYDARLAVAYERVGLGNIPDIDVRAKQMKMMFSGFDPGPIDGIMGPKTDLALAAFNSRHGPHP